jgi:hypothetical protein
MSRKLGDTIHLDFTTHNPTTGSISDADGTPTCEVFEDDNDTPILSPTVTKRTSKTGNYRVPVAATASNGFEVGKSYNVVVSATVNGKSAKSCIASFTLDSKRLSDLNDLSQSDILSDATPFAGADIEAIKNKTDNLPSDPADESLLEAAIALAHSTTDGKVDALQLDVTAIKNSTDNLPLDPASESQLEDAILASEAAIRGTDSDDLKVISDQIDGVGGSAPTAGEVADAVWDEAIADHVADGSFGKKINDTGSIIFEAS